MPRASDLHQDRVIDQTIEKVGLNHDRRTRLAAAQVGVKPVDQDDLPAVHASVRMRSSSAGLSHARPKGRRTDRTFS